MIALDTNVLVRFIAQDDPQQSRKADHIMGSLTKENPGWVGVSTILELVWVINSSIRPGRMGIANMITQLLTRDSIVIENAKAVENAVFQFRRGKADFADCLIASSAAAAGCSRTLTFDRIAARDAGMQLIA
ncbi:MAG: type II toxin-antitoxin system VapC family toxin [Terracidiphilus sp.]